MQHRYLIYSGNKANSSNSQDVSALPPMFSIDYNLILLPTRFSAFLCLFWSDAKAIGQTRDKRGFRYQLFWTKELFNFSNRFVLPAARILRVIYKHAGRYEWTARELQASFKFPPEFFFSFFPFYFHHKISSMRGLKKFRTKFPSIFY